MVELKQLDELIGTMLRHRVLRVKVGTIEVELSPLAFAQVEPTEPSSTRPIFAEDDEACECGHSFSEHGAAGCFRGCTVESCLSEVSQTE